MSEQTFAFTHDDPEMRSLANLLERAVAEDPDRVWLNVGASRSFTLGECDRLANRLAHGLLARGVGAGDRVAVLTPNCLESVIAWFAAAKIGAIYFPINIHFRGGLLTHAFELTSPKVAIVVDSLRGICYEAAASIDVTFVVIPDEPGVPVLANPPWILFDDLLSDTSDSPAVEVFSSNAQSIVLTSGTTGPSKGVVLSNHQAYVFADIVGQATRLSPSDTYYICLPLFHINAQLSVLTSLIFGNRIAIFPKFSASSFWEEIRATNSTVASLFGSMPQILLKHESAGLASKNGLRACWVFPAPASTRESFERAFDLKVLTAYASTEANFVSVSGISDVLPSDSVGKIHPLFEVMISGPADTAVSQGMRGEILVRPRVPFTTMLGYFEMPEATVLANRNLWFHTGDVGFLDSEGYLYFVDRLNDAIRRNGENISSMEVEAVIVDHPSVLECAVIGIAGEMAEQDIMAFVVTQQDDRLSAEELQTWCQDRMAYFMIPRFWKFVEELPKTPNGKVQKSLLKATVQFQPR